MKNNKIDKNAKLAFEEYKYEIADELGIDKPIGKREKFSVKKLINTAKNKFNRAK